MWYNIFYNMWSKFYRGKDNDFFVEKYYVIVFIGYRRNMWNLLVIIKKMIFMYFWCWFLEIIKLG